MTSAALLTLLALGSACQICNEGICSNRLVLALAEEGGEALRDGAYAVEVTTVDGDLVEGTCQVSDGGHDASCAGPPGVLGVRVFGSPSNPVTQLSVELRDQNPESVSIVVHVNDELVLDESVEPDYAWTEDYCTNCRSAQVDLELL